ncbi:MAG: ABC transporter ATP-binding protein [Candidatus Nanopelagicales bacterium]
MIALLRRFLRPYSRSLVIVVLLLLVQAMANLFLPTLNADIINKGVVTGDIGYIWRIGVVMLAVTAALGVTSVAAVYFSARTAMGFGRDVRAALFAKVQRFSLYEVNTFGTPSLITRNTNDVQQVQMLVLMGLTMMVLAPITAIGGVIMALRLNVQLSAMLLVVIPLMAIVIGVLMARAIPLFRSMQIKIDAINDVLRETLTGIRVIRAFVRTRDEEERFADANADLTDTSLRVARLFAIMLPALMLIMNGSSVAVIWFGGHLVDSGSMQIGDLTAFLQYLIQILFSVMMAVMLFVMVPRAAASSERIDEVLATVPAITDPATPVPERPGRGLVCFEHVTFRYPGAEDAVLEDVSFTAEPGQTTAIVGGTGSGKTTLVNLIPRLYDVSEGRVSLDGVNVRDLRQADVWSAMAIVPQKAFLFSGTVASNVRFGRPGASDAQVWQALQTAQAEEFVRGLPEGLDAPIDQGGANVSGGQRQRLAIARALVRQADVLILDDSFSALDYATDARLRRALRTAAADTTVIVVAQRVSTIMQADQIIVLDDGRIVGRGTHDELLAECETYREIVASQLTAEEAA